MKHITKWFAPDLAAYRDDPYWPGLRRYQRPLVDHYGDRLRLVIGDVCSEMETDNGDYAGLSFGIELSLYVNIGQFDRQQLKGEPGAKFEDHSFSLTFWRWGIYLAVRGRQIEDPR